MEKLTGMVCDGGCYKVHTVSMTWCSDYIYHFQSSYVIMYDIGCSSENMSKSACNEFAMFLFFLIIT